MITDETITEMFMVRYEGRDMESRLDKDRFKALYKEAVKDFYPKLKEEYHEQSIYGISFEIANVVQRVFADDFYTIVYVNTEEMYEEKCKECDEDEKDYYRFEPCEWGAIVTPGSSLFEKVQDYLKENSLSVFCGFSHYAHGLSEETVAWYEEHELDFDYAFEQERGQIRLWLAEAFGELRRERFWDIQGNADIYVFPFRGECDIDYEEIVRTFHEMNQNCHGTEFLDYLAKEQGE